MTDNNNNMSTGIVRVGFIGASHIAMQTWASIASTHNKVTIVGCRSSAKAQLFINECVQTLHLSEEDTPIVGSYEDVVQSHNVDVVYISIPVTERNEWIRSCAAHGKHVVGEKPCARDCNELQGWIDALSQKHLLYMDGTMFSHGERLKSIVKQVNESEYVPISHIYTNFSICTDDHFMQHDIRVHPELEPHGALGDVGWYCICVILHLMKFQMPINVRGRVLQRHPKTHAIIAFSGELIFATNNDNIDRVVAQFFCSFNSACEQVVQVGTANGLITINDFVMPNSYHDAEWHRIANKFWNANCTNHAHRSIATSSLPYRTTMERDAMWNDIRRFVHRATQEMRESSHAMTALNEMQYWASLSLKTQEVMDRLLQSALHNSIEM